MRALVVLLAAGLSGCIAPGAEGENDTDVPAIVLPSDDKSDTAIATVNPAECPRGAPAPTAAWTLIHYAAADNDLEPVLLEDISEMEVGHGGTEQVNVLVQLDKRVVSGVWRYEIQPDRDRETIGSKLVGYSSAEPDSGDWRTLAAFGQWAVTCYPAEQYMVVVGGHSNGWSGSGQRGGRGGRFTLRERAMHELARDDGEALRLIAPDETNGTSMRVSELERALRHIRGATVRDGDPEWQNRLVIYGSDACLMQTAEVAWQLRNTAMFLLGSEETEPGKGWPYSTVLDALTHRPFFYAQRPWALVEMVVEKYGKHYSPWGAGGPVDQTTLAAVDGSRMVVLENRVRAVAGLLSGLLADHPSREAIADAVLEARRASFTFGEGFTDLGLLLANLRRVLVREGLMPEVRARFDGDERLRELRDAIDDLTAGVLSEAIVASGTGEAYAGAFGMSIYFPLDRCAYGLDVESYGATPFGAETGWAAVIDAVVGEELGDHTVRWGFGQGSLDATVDGIELPTMPLRCEIEDGWIYLSSDARSCISVGGDCVGAPKLSAELMVRGETASVAGAYARWSYGPLNIDHELRNLGEVRGAEVTGRRIAGTIEVVHEGTPVSVRFLCDRIRDRSCRE